MRRNRLRAVTRVLLGATAALLALTAAVQGMPDGAQVGLAVYGSQTGSSDAEKQAGCQDYRTVSPLGPLNRQGLTTAANSFQPRGYTPIGFSLQQAAAALPREGPHSIVLVTDGEDTCAPPDPCEVARNLARQGVDLRVHTVGLLVDQNARSQLTCIAQATGGTYHDATSAGSLGDALATVSDRALRHYEPAGTPVRGGKTAKDAPTLKAGQYLEPLDATDEGGKRYYAMDVPAGVTADVRATAIYTTPPDADPVRQDLQVDLGAADQSGCASDPQILMPSSTGQGSRILASGVQVRPENGATAACKKPGRYTFSVQRKEEFVNQIKGADRVPIEITVSLEPPVTGDKGPAPNSQPVAFQEPAGSARTVLGGSSFGDAAGLDGPGSYQDTISSGELAFYRVKLDWGQGLAYRVTFGNASGTPFDVAQASTFAYSPTRASLGGQDNVQILADRDNPPMGVVATPRVLFRNRELSDGDRKQASHAGTYYAVVHMDYPRGGQTLEYPIHIDVSVSGSAAGAPGFQSMPGLQATPGATAPADDSRPTGQRRAGPPLGLPVVVWALAAAGALALIAAATTIGVVVAVRRVRPR
jgi:Ca-activated chloride channel homolog